ncbi:MAG: DUF934 domain-containing protein [Luminiphilus sp.]|nr:DUF934 domain-containing protein [Gammaproteobacteria bacterium]
MTALIRINQEGQFSEIAEGDAVASALPVGDVASHDQITQLLDLSTVRLQVDGFVDGRGFTVARQLRLLGFAGVIEVIGDLLPDQLPMAAASGIDAILIRAEHAGRCEESQWRLKSRDKNRFGYQRSVA